MRLLFVLPVLEHYSHPLFSPRYSPLAIQSQARAIRRADFVRPSSLLLLRRAGARTSTGRPSTMVGLLHANFNRLQPQHDVPRLAISAICVHSRQRFKIPSSVYYLGNSGRNRITPIHPQHSPPLAMQPHGHYNVATHVTHLPTM